MGLGSASNAQVWSAFQKLTPVQQDTFALDIFYLVLRDAGRDHNDPNAVNGTRNYEKGFQAIADLFPSNQAWKGDISVASREIATKEGGDINLLVPGGELLVGFDTAQPPPDQGILTARGGNISIFTDGNVTLGTSRIFTLQGGNEIIWSTHGNIAAGAAAKTLQAAQPTRFLINGQTGAPILDLAGLATGGGIGTLQTLKSVPPANVDLIAPNGFIDAGDAGIRVSGNINLAAVAVLNAANIQVQGTTTGIPTVQGPPVGALTAANSTAGASQAAAPAVTNSTTNNRASIIIVEVIGYGGVDQGTEAPAQPQNDKQHKSDNDQSYNPNSSFKLLGNGALTQEQQKNLTDEERSKLRQLQRSNAL
jgi:hypothetical protein